MILPRRAATTSEPNMEVEMSLAELTGRQLSVVYQNVCDLKLRTTNPRTHSKKQIAQIAGAIRRFGFTNPVLVDEDKGVARALQGG
jgi:hypothetical protein